MMRQCGLAPELNKCPYYIRDKQECGADHQKCGFYESPGAPKETDNAKEPKWFERYYKK